MNKVVEIKAQIFDVIAEIENENESHKVKSDTLHKRRLELLVELEEAKKESV